jgi:superfamily I DNA/RNA helicase
MTLVRQAWRPQGVADLEPRAWEALRESARSVLVTAGAGAGKTEFLAQKATYLLQTGICPAPKRILAISFKRDAARNLAERVERRCPPEQARRFDSLTFDAFTKHLLDQFRAAIPEDFRPPAVYRIAFPGKRDREEFLRRHGYHGIDERSLENAIARMRLPLDPGATHPPLMWALAQYWHDQYNHYDEVLLSFPMINRLVEYLLRENSDIQRALQITYPFVFLDEFQDTTFAQFELVQTAFSGSSAIFTAVGDDKQRIMGWAGAMPNAFAAFEAEFAALRIHLLSNWRSHEELVRIQHLIASQIDPRAEPPQARGSREVSGDIAAIWQFADRERTVLAEWMLQEIRNAGLQPHDFAILVRLFANNVEAELSPAFEARGLTLRNVARSVGEIAIQDLLGEDLTAVLVPLMRLGSCPRHAAAWSEAQRKLRFLEALSDDDELGHRRLLARLEHFLKEIRGYMNATAPDEAAVAELTSRVLEFVGESLLRQAFPAYQRAPDFERVRNGFELLLRECALPGGSWPEVLDRFEGVGQIALMTIHKSKGLEFHTMVFYGLDDGTWRSLSPRNPEELNSFFVAFTRAKQRAFFTLCDQRGRPITWLESILEPAGLWRIDGASILENVVMPEEAPVQ